MTEEIVECQTEGAVVPPKFKAKRDIVRFGGERPTAVNLEHASIIYLEGKRITFEFYTKAQHIDLDDESIAKTVFEQILNSWASDVVE